MGKFNLSEAAKEILQASVSAKQGGQDKPAKLHGDVAYGTKEAGDIGTQVTKPGDSGPDATKGVPTATAPGASAPVGSEPAKHLEGDKDQQSKGRSDLAQDPTDKDADSYESIRDRKATKLAPQTMKANPGATFQSYDEETEERYQFQCDDERQE